jgi:hypothetical protein
MEQGVVGEMKASNGGFDVVINDDLRLKIGFKLPKHMTKL